MKFLKRLYLLKNIYLSENVIFQRFHPVSKFHFSACTTLVIILYYLLKVGEPFVMAEEFCQTNNGKLASIHSAEVNSWLTAHAVDDMWIGLKGLTQSSDIPETWTSDGSPLDFDAFGGLGPIIGEGLILSHLPENDWRGHWYPHNVTTFYHAPLCETNPIPGVPDSPSFPTPPPNEFCDPGWHVFMNEDGKMKCVQFQNGDMSWQASLDTIYKYHVYCSNKVMVLIILNSVYKSNRYNNKLNL